MNSPTTPFTRTIIRRIMTDPLVDKGFTLALKARDSLTATLKDTEFTRDPKRATRILRDQLELEQDQEKLKQYVEALAKYTGPAAEALASNAQRNCVEALLLLRKCVEITLDPLANAVNRIGEEVIKAEADFAAQFDELREPTHIFGIVQNVLQQIDAERQHLARLHSHPTHLHNLAAQHADFFAYFCVQK